MNDDISTDLTEEKYYYSEQRGFLQESRRQQVTDGDGWPDDAKEISRAVYDDMLSGQNNEKMIIADDDGYPMLADIPGPSHEQAVAAAEAQKQVLLNDATSKINTLQDAVDLDMASDSDIQILKKWRIYRVNVSRVDTSLAPDIDWPSIPQ